MFIIMSLLVLHIEIPIVSSCLPVPAPGRENHQRLQKQATRTRRVRCRTYHSNLPWSLFQRVHLLLIKHGHNMTQGRFHYILVEPPSQATTRRMAVSYRPFKVHRCSSWIWSLSNCKWTTIGLIWRMLRIKFTRCKCVLLSSCFHNKGELVEVVRRFGEGIYKFSWWNRNKGVSRCFKPRFKFTSTMNSPTNLPSSVLAIFFALVGTALSIVAQ